MKISDSPSLDPSHSGLHAINQSETRCTDGGGHLKIKSQGCPPNAGRLGSEARGDNANPGRGSLGSQRAAFSLPSIACPPAASRGCIGGLRRRWTRGGPRRRVAPSPSRAAPTAAGTPGSSARRPPGVGGSAPTRARSPAGS